VILAGKPVEFSKDFRAACRRCGFEPEAIVSVSIDQHTMKSAGKWFNGIDLEPWNVKEIIVGATFTATLADGQVRSFDWFSDQPWATMTVPKGSIK
jgi:hypothetical protein